jgi:hypothetical protein
MNTEVSLQIKKDAIRHHFDEKSNKRYYSVVDVVGIIANTADPRNYWKVLKNRLNKANNQLVTECNQLKMKASDGKFYLTDVGDKKMILKMVKMTAPEALPYFEDFINLLEQKNGLREVSLKVIRGASSANQKPTYPQVKNTKHLSQNKMRMKSI